MNSEFYTGWLTHWGEPKMKRKNKKFIAKSLRNMLNANVNVNFYMFCGGTNFEFNAGKFVFIKFCVNIRSITYVFKDFHDI